MISIFMLLAVLASLLVDPSPTRVWVTTFVRRNPPDIRQLADFGRLPPVATRRIGRKCGWPPFPPAKTMPVPTSLKGSPMKQRSLRAALAIGVAGLVASGLSAVPANAATVVPVRPADLLRRALRCP